MDRRPHARPSSPAPPGRGFRWIAAILLGLLGYFLNLLPVGLSPGTDLIFGGVAYLLAASTLGPAAGLLAAAIASARTLWLWNHPYAFLIFCAEAVLVGWLVRRKGLRPMVADLIYWVCLGLPLLVLFYRVLLGITGATVLVIGLKQPLNGLIDALFVEMLLLFPAVRRKLRLRGAPRLQSAFAVILALTAVLPALAFGVWMGQREWKRNVERARDRVALFAQAYSSKLEQYVLLYERAVRSVGQAAERRGEFNPEQLQRLTSVEREQFSGFVNIYAADSRGAIVAAHPAASDALDARIGLDVSDRPFFREVRRTLEPVISDVVRDRAGRSEPLIVIAQPIVLADTFAGFVLGALDLKALPEPHPAPGSTERLRVADRRGILIFDSHDGRRDGEHRGVLTDSAAFAAVSQIQDVGTTSYIGGRVTAAPAVTAAQVLAGVVRIPDLGWWVWMEEPFSEIHGFVAEAYVRLFALLIAVTLLALLVSSTLAGYLVRPLLRLRAAAAALAAGDRAARAGPLPPAVPVELAELSQGFDEMADALAGRTDELEELGEIARSLASTLDMEELLRRITEAADRLVSSDGCGIALLASDGETLRAADYSLGLLAPAAGRRIPLEASLLGVVTRRGEPVLIEEVESEPHALERLIDPTLLRSVICAPLVGRSGMLGALVAVRGRRNPAPFTAADLRLLERLAGNAAVAVENARLLEAAESASRTKSDFIATMSHELRTPINAVIGHVELLSLGIHGELNGAQREALTRIATAIRHLRGLIEEVLSFSRLEAGRAEVQVRETDLGSIAYEVATVMEPLAREKGIELGVQLAPGSTVVVHSDPDKIRQILINLTGNAVKFTERGTVHVRIGARDGEAWVAVSDTGIGISPEDRGRLFRPFEQLETGLSRSHGGTGLGLYLSGQYARLIGGRIEVESEPGQGSVFTLVLPRAEGVGMRE